jgi:ribonuclease-3
LAEVIKTGAYKDAKSKFQEASQDKEGVTPCYKVTKETGPDHNKKFYSWVYLKDNLVAEGEGSSKQEAEEAAAKKALENKNWK